MVESNHAGYTGTGFVNYDNLVGSYVEWTVTAPAGPADVTLRYANGTAATRPMDFTVNGVPGAVGITFPGTGAWTTWQTKTVRLTARRRHEQDPRPRDHAPTAARTPTS